MRDVQQHKGVVRMVQLHGRDAGADYKEAFRLRLFSLVSEWERVHRKRVPHKEIAAFIGNQLREKAVHPTQVGRWINGDTLPEMHRVEPLANYFGASGAFLTRGDGEAPEKKEDEAAGGISA